MRRSKQSDGERIVKDIKRKTRKQYSAEESERSANGSRNSEPVLSWTVFGVKRALLRYVGKKA